MADEVYLAFHDSFLDGPRKQVPPALSRYGRQRIFNLLYQEMLIRNPKCPETSLASYLEITLQAIDGYKRGEYTLKSEHLEKALAYLPPQEWLQVFLDDYAAQLRGLLNLIIPESPGWAENHGVSDFKVDLTAVVRLLCAKEDNSCAPTKDSLDDDTLTIVVDNPLVVRARQLMCLCNVDEQKHGRHEVPDWADQWSTSLTMDYWDRALDHLEAEVNRLVQELGSVPKNSLDSHDAERYVSTQIQLRGLNERLRRALDTFISLMKNEKAHAKRGPKINKEH